MIFFDFRKSNFCGKIGDIYERLHDDKKSIFMGRYVILSKFLVSEIVVFFDIKLLY